MCIIIGTNGRLTLIELVQEGALYGFPAIPLNKASEELVVHLPAIHGFLEFHAFFGDEDVDDPWVGNGTVMFEPLADDVAEVGWRDAEGVEGAYFRSLEFSTQFSRLCWGCGCWTHGTVPVSVERENALTSFCGV